MDIRLCSNCFTDQGLRLDAERIGTPVESKCPNCGDTSGRKLTEELVSSLAQRFFVWGTIHKCDYGAAPIIQFNDRQETSISTSSWLAKDTKLISDAIGVGFFLYWPRLWMVGEVEPLKDLQEDDSREKIIQRILHEYPSIILDSDRVFYRIRKAPELPDDVSEYDSPPAQFLGTGRLDSDELPIMYLSEDLEICIHECRVTAEDDLYVATLSPTRQLKLLNLFHLLVEEHTTEFESLDMAVHMLFLAGRHSYKICREIAKSAAASGFDGLIYPSYFSLLRIGARPFETAYGISYRKFEGMQEYEQAKSIPNFALFGRPIAEEKLNVRCINRFILNCVSYNYHFGPVRV